MGPEKKGKGVAKEEGGGGRKERRDGGKRSDRRGVLLVKAGEVMVGGLEIPKFGSSTTTGLDFNFGGVLGAWLVGFIGLLLARVSKPHYLSSFASAEAIDDGDIIDRMMGFGIFIITLSIEGEEGL
ncbi:hypothetical protein ACH5RR_022522 [Cinchona calisaya]|uniref:Uncharacterized protein n=1 Tax=Cinchona calisaya TaxID=153742 RepID=A0ABD2ZBB7_9GENT